MRRETSISCADLDPELVLLGIEARGFFLSQGITTVHSLLTGTSTERATTLARLTNHTLSMAKAIVNGWRADVRQRLATREEHPVGLHWAFEVFNADIRSFFVAVSIATPSDLFEHLHLGQEYMDWRRDNNMYVIRIATLRTYASKWKESVKRQSTLARKIVYV
jgi:hypothetical protein